MRMQLAAINSMMRAVFTTCRAVLSGYGVLVVSVVGLPSLRGTFGGSIETKGAPITLSFSKDFCRWRIDTKIRGPQLETMEDIDNTV
jgi:hypothetical protein